MTQPAHPMPRTDPRRESEPPAPLIEPPPDTSAALAEASEAVRLLWTRAIRDEVRARYSIGQLLCTVRSARQTYGEHAVERIAATLRRSVHALYRFAAVAESWHPDEFYALSVRTSAAGEPLSWWHWVALTKVVATVPRRHMAERCLAEGWSVRELARAIDASHRATSARKDDELSEGESVRVALVEGVQNASRAAFQMRVFTEALKSRLADGPRDEKYLQRALKAHEALRENVEATLAYLREVTESPGRRVPSGVRVRVEAPRRAERIEEAAAEEEVAEGALKKRRRRR